MKKLLISILVSFLLLTATPVLADPGIFDEPDSSTIIAVNTSGSDS